jgi:hypothetical protein
MTVEVYKGQAARLAEHLSSVHKVRLKHAGTLEAIAAVHNERDWNTLVAGASKRAATGAAAHAIPMVRFTPDSGNAFLFSRHSFADLAFCDAMLTQPLHLKAGFAGEKRAIVDHLLSRQINRGGGFLYICDGDRQRLDNIAGAMEAAGRAKQFRVLAPMWPELTEVCNPLAEGDADQLASIALRLLPQSEGNPGSDFYRQSANYALTVIFGALLAIKETPSFRRLTEILAKPDVGLPRLQERLPESERETFALFIAPFLKSTKMGPMVDADRLNVTLGGIAGRSAMLSQGSLAELLNPSKGGLSWKQVIRDGEGVFLDASRMGQNDTFEKVLLGSFQSALYGVDSSEMAQPFTIFLDSEHSTFATEQLQRAAQDRGIGLIRTNRLSGLDAQVEAVISAAGGFGRAARVALKDTSTGYETSAELKEFTGWPTSILPYARG